MATKRLTITNSERRTFTGCRRAYWFRYIEYLEPVFSAAPLRFGSLIHDCLKSFHLREAVLFSDRIQQWRDAYVVDVNQTSDPDALADIDTSKVDKMAELANGIMLRYVEKYGDDLNRWEILGVEQPFRFPLHTPCTDCKGAGKVGADKCTRCKGSGIGRRSPQWDQAGVIDLIVGENGLVWVVEHKTTSATSRDAYESELLLDTQPRSYLWAVKQMAEKHGWGKVGGILYNVMRKKLPADPHELKCKSCKGSCKPTKTALKADPSLTECPTCVGTGVIGISQKQGTDTTIEKYAAAIKKHPHLDVNDYEDTLSMLQARGDRFLWRFYHHVSEADLNDWELETYQVTRDISQTDRYYRNPNACAVPGRRCAFRRICIEDDPMARRSFKFRSEHHPEVKAEEIAG